MCIPGAHRNQKRVLDPLELELWAAMSCYVGAETQTEKDQSDVGSMQL